MSLLYFEKHITCGPQLFVFGRGTQGNPQSLAPVCTFFKIFLTPPLGRDPFKYSHLLKLLFLLLFVNVPMIQGLAYGS